MPVVFTYRGSGLVGPGHSLATETGVMDNLFFSTTTEQCADVWQRFVVTIGPTIVGSHR